MKVSFALALVLFATGSLVALSAKTGKLASLKAKVAVLNPTAGGSDPMGSVINALQEMLAHGQRQIQAAEITHTEFETFCRDNKISMDGEVIRDAETLAREKAENAKLVADAVAIGKQITQLRSDIESWTAKLKGGAAERESDHTEFVANQKDYSESIQALEGAQQVLAKQDVEHAGTALLQLSNNAHLPSQTKSVIAEFMTMMNDANSNELGAPTVDAYEFQGGGILEMVKKMKSDFESKLHDLEMDETNSAHAFKLIKSDLTDSIQMAIKDLSEKSQTKAGRLYRISMGEKNVQLYSKEELEDKKRFEQLKLECGQKNAIYAEESKVRQEEVEAIQKAIQFLVQNQVKEKMDTHILTPENAASSFAQVKSLSGNQGVRHRVREFISKEAKRLHSDNLSLLATKLMADPFAKVKQMIQNMVQRLKEESSADTEKKEFCDKQTSKSTVTRTQLTEEVDSLTAKVDDMNAQLLQIADENAALQKELAGIDEEMATASKLRKEEKDKNAATLEDATTGLAAIHNASEVLSEFYKANAPPAPPAEATLAFVQTRSSTKAPYNGMHENGNFIVTVLEIIAESFSDLQADTNAAEMASSKSYEENIEEAKKTRFIKQDKVEVNNIDKAALANKLQEGNADLRAVQDQLQAAEKFAEQINKQCAAKGMTYEERVNARQDEVQSLKEALTILSSEE